MGCLQISAHRVGESLKMTASRYGDALQISAQRTGERLMITASLVCNVSEVSRLEVSPSTIWLTPENLYSGDFDIVSNVNWLID